MTKSFVSMESQWLARILRLQVSAGLLLALNLSANAVETARERCERASQRRSSHRGVFVRHSDGQRSPSACDGVFQSSRLVFEERRCQSGRV